MPRRLAISSGRCSDFSPAIVARATLMWLAEPSDLHKMSWTAGLFEDDAGRATGDDAGTGRGRLHHDPPTAGLADHRVDDRRPGHRNLEQVALGLFGALLDRQRHFFGLAVAQPDPTVAVTDDDERGEAEATTALDDLGDAVDGDDARLAQSTLIVVANRIGCSAGMPSELQTCVTSGFGDRSDTTVVGESTAVEHDRGDAGGLGALGDEFADAGGAGDGATAPEGALVGLDGRRRRQRGTGRRRRSLGPRCACWTGTRPNGAGRRCRGPSCGPDDDDGCGLDGVPWQCHS